MDRVEHAHYSESPSAGRCLGGLGRGLAV